MHGIPCGADEVYCSELTAWVNQKREISKPNYTLSQTQVDLQTDINKCVVHLGQARCSSVEPLLL